jgi:prepilin-type N-terminal cleavage/methylation domain-containing protein
MTAKPRVASKNAGFSLIEAIVALVILSLVFTAVWGWFGTAITSSAKIENAVALPRVFSQFTIQLELENLANKNNGEYFVGDYQLQWQATVVKSSLNEPYRRQPAWIVTLYDINASIWLKGRQIDSFNTQLVQQQPDPAYIDPAEFGG